MIYPIVVYGASVLKKEAEEITPGSIDVIKLKEDMFKTLQQSGGIGLAAPQIGQSLRLFIVDGRPLKNKEMRDFHQVFINPEMVWEKGEKWEYEEGCLSIPGIREKVSRHAAIRINYLDEHFREHEEEFDGMKARIIQHEYDHINGVLFIDHLAPLKKRLLKNKLNHIAKGKCHADYKIQQPTRHG